MLESYLAREDAVSNIGGAIAGVLLKAAPDRPASIHAVVQFMRRKDQTAESKDSTLISISLDQLQKHEIGRAVAAYADDPDEQISGKAIMTLRGMGTGVVEENRPALTRIAKDSRRSEGVRRAAAETLASAP